MRGLDQKPVIVTGGASGIGKAIGLRLGEESARVAIFDMNEKGAEAAAAEIRQKGGEAWAYKVDITDYAAVARAVDAFEKAAGQVYGLVNNAGWDEAKPFIQTEPDFWKKVIDINLYGPLNLTHVVARRLAEQGAGRVVSISSDAGRVGSSGEAVYSAAKGGVIAFMKTMAREFARKGVTFNTICPGPTDTPLLASVDASGGGRLTEALTKAIPMRRLAQPDDYPGMVAFFLSDDASFITGQTISVSGGLSMHGCRGIFMDYEDILYDEKNGVATITINRPKVYNAFRPRTCVELIDAFLKAGWSEEIGAIVLTGAGNKAFCTGGDQSDHDGSYGDGETRGTIGMPVEELHTVIRDVPKPVIAKVRGYAIGGGNVLATLCDMTIAGESAIFGQVGPKMGSVDPGFGTAYLARVVGEKKAREIWYMCRRYPAREALAMGLANAVVPDDKLDEEVDAWCAELVERSPTAIAIAKKSFNADSDNIRGIGGLGMQALRLYYNSAESKEGVNALNEKRKPEFRKHMK